MRFLKGKNLSNTRHGGDAVIYEVTLNVNADIIAEFDVWLTQHVHEILQLPGFVGAKIFHPQAQMPSPDDGSPVQRVVQYALASQTDLDNYLHQHAESMRAQGIARFGDQFHASRRVFNVPTDVPAMRAASMTVTDIQPRCLNCGAALTGKFCAECGQKNHTYAAPLRSVIEDFFGNHFGFDTKFFHSILPLLFRPGFLSREYSAGRRACYINPLRLYIFSSILFFFFAWTFASPGIKHISNSGTSRLFQSTGGQQIPGKQTSSDSYNVSNRSTGTLTNSDQEDTTTGEIFGRKFSMNRAEFVTRATQVFESNLPKLMFVFLPLVALLLKLFYIPSKRYYMEHLIFTLHNHAFVFVAMLCILLAETLPAHVAWLTWPVQYFKDIVGWYIVIYIFLAMLFYYRQSFIKTLLKFFLIGLIYWITLVTTIALGAVLLFTEVVAF